MKNLTTILLIFLVSILCTPVNAQSLAVEGGLNLSTWLDRDDEEKYSKEYEYIMIPGFHLGATVNVPFRNFLSFEPGAYLSTKGVRDEDSFLGIDVNSKVSLMYLDVPLNIKVTYPMGGMIVFGTAGPYVGLGLSGKVKDTMEDGGQTETQKEDVKWGNDPDEHHLKRLDWGATLGAGVEMNSIIFEISYDYGLANISAYQEDGYRTRNRVIKVSLGYRIGTF